MDLLINTQIIAFCVASIRTCSGCGQIGFYIERNTDRFFVHLLLMCVALSFRLSSCYIQGLFVSCHRYSKHRNILSYVNDYNTNKFKLGKQFHSCLQRFPGILGLSA
jgi:hypothetical protein